MILITNEKYTGMAKPLTVMTPPRTKFKKCSIAAQNKTNEANFITTSLLTIFTIINHYNHSIL